MSQQYRCKCSAGKKLKLYYGLICFCCIQSYWLFHSESIGLFTLLTLFHFFSPCWQICLTSGWNDAWSIWVSVWCMCTNFQLILTQPPWRSTGCDYYYRIVMATHTETHSLIEDFFIPWLDPVHRSFCTVYCTTVCICLLNSCKIFAVFKCYLSYRIIGIFTYLKYDYACNPHDIYPIHCLPSLEQSTWIILLCAEKDAIGFQCLSKSFRLLLQLEASQQGSFNDGMTVTDVKWTHQIGFVISHYLYPARRSCAHSQTIDSV